MSENVKNDLKQETLDESIKELAEALKNMNASSEEIDLSGNEEISNNETSSFKVAGSNLPVKPSAWTRMKNVLFYEIKVELTPYQQKIENEINEFLHAPITWKSLKEAALSEVPITFRGKRIF